MGENTMWVKTFLECGFFFLGIIFLIITASVSVWGMKRKKRCTECTSAVVIGEDKTTSYNYSDVDSEYWNYTYEYTYNGIKYKRRSTVGGYRKLGYVGTTVKIFVNPDNPSEFYCPDNELNVVLNVFAVAGCLLIAFAVFAGVCL